MARLSRSVAGPVTLLAAIAALSLGGGAMALAASNSANASPDSQDGCVFNDSTFNYSTDTLNESGHMTDCTKGNLGIHANLDGVEDNGPINCGNTTSCSLPDHIIQTCWAAGQHEVVVYGSRQGSGNIGSPAFSFFITDAEAAAESC